MLHGCVVEYGLDDVRVGDVYRAVVPLENVAFKVGGGGSKVVDSIFLLQYGEEYVDSRLRWRYWWGVVHADC